MSKGIVFRTKSNEKIYPCPYFPVGSIYMSLSSTNPSTYFGGTWVQIKDSFLLGAGNSYSAGNSGGSASHSHTTGNHTLSINEIPSHTHIFTGNNVNSVGKASYPHWTGGYGEQPNSASLGFTPIAWTGGSQAHNHGDTGSSSHMPPYYVVYIWRRTA